MVKQASREVQEDVIDLSTREQGEGCEEDGAREGGEGGRVTLREILLLVSTRGTVCT